MASIYDACLWDLDRATAALLDGLDARGVLDDTVVVVTSDHGENLGERGMYEHRWDLHDTLVHVPLVVRYPHAVAPGRRQEPVSTAHLYGTLTELASLPAPGVGHPLPALGAARQVFAELVVPGVRDAQILKAYDALDPKRWQRRYQAVYEGNLKLLRSMPGDDELFDVVADPRERSDVSGTRRDELEHLREVLAEWKRTRPAYDPSRRAPDDHPRKPGSAEGGVADQLRALGYTHEDGEDEASED
jgi:arylsulfatase A-like enzyme